MQHSKIVGGSTAKRVINCPGSVALVAKMPPQLSSKYADEGTMLHEAISKVLLGDMPQDVIGTVYEGQTLTQELYDNKIVVALDLLDQVDPEKSLMYEVEMNVNFGDVLPGVFGSADLVGRIGDRAIVLDWKFGDGVVVSAEENEQLMFYAAAAMRTPETAWAFDECTEIELIIVQPPVVRRWVTTHARIKQFERDLVRAVMASEQPDAKLAMGDHCKWCAAKPICPQMTGSADRALRVVMKDLNADQLGSYLTQADQLEGWIKDLRGLATQLLENNMPVPGYKLVNKQARRQWADEAKAAAALHDMGLPRSEIFKEELLSPAQAEKVLKKSKTALPDALVKSVSSGTTLAPVDDPRPAVQSFVGLSKALSKLQ